MWSFYNRNDYILNSPFDSGHVNLETFSSPNIISIKENNNFDEFNCYNEEEEDINQYYNLLEPTNLEKSSENNTPIEEKVTAITMPKECLNDKKDKISEEIKKNSSKIYFFEDILKIFLEHNDDKTFNKILKNFKKDDLLKKAEESIKLIQKKRKRRKKSELKIEENVGIEIKYNRGRKQKNDQTKRKHTNMKEDNIIKKVKSKIFKCALITLNNILNKNNEKEKNNILKELDYKYINKLKKETDIEFLEMPLKELFSKNITPKYSSIDINSNKFIIQKILEEEENNEIVMFILNLKLKEWLDLFTMKKNINDFNNLSKDDCDIFEEKLASIHILLNDILEKNEGTYLSLFIFYLFNYENYFSNKQGRRRIPKEMKKNKK